MAEMPGFRVSSGSDCEIAVAAIPGTGSAPIDSPRRAGSGNSPVNPRRPPHRFEPKKAEPEIPESSALGVGNPRWKILPQLESLFLQLVVENDEIIEIYKI